MQKRNMNMENVMTQAEREIREPKTRKLSEVIEDIEVGNVLIVHSVANQSTIGGYVKKKILKHDPNTHEEFYDIELDVEGTLVSLDPYEDYYVLRLVSIDPGEDYIVHDADNEQGKFMPEEDELEEDAELVKKYEELQEKIDKMIERYELEEDEPIYNSFCKMVNHWDARTEDEREIMAMALERFIDHEDIYTILQNTHNLLTYIYRLLMDIESYRMALERVGR